MIVYKSDLWYMIPILIFYRKNPQNSKPPNGSRRGLHFIALPGGNLVITPMSNGAPTSKLQSLSGVVVQKWTVSLVGCCLKLFQQTFSNSILHLSSILVSNTVLWICIKNGIKFKKMASRLASGPTASRPGLLTWMSFWISSALDCSLYGWHLFV